MAGRGPAPKPRHIRQRRNQASTEAAMITDELPRLRAPSLGDHPGKHEWDARTERWWRDVWASPMAARFLRADEGGLHMLAVLVDAFWREPSTQLAAEIRLQRQCFGLTPTDRRRLQWEVARMAEQEGSRSSKHTATGDPRDALRAV